MIVSLRIVDTIDDVDVTERSGRTDGRRRRRLWSADEKQAMLAESLAPRVCGECG